MDGKSIGAVASYKFVKVQTAHTIEARFATAPMKDPDTGFSDIAKSDYFYDAVRPVRAHRRSLSCGALPVLRRRTA